MKYSIGLLLLAIFIMLLPGCGGGLSQDSLKRNAIRRSKDDQDEKPPAEKPQSSPEKSETDVADSDGESTQEPINNLAFVEPKPLPTPIEAVNPPPTTPVEPAQPEAASSPPEERATDTEPAAEKPMTPEQQMAAAKDRMAAVAKALNDYLAVNRRLPTPAIKSSGGRSLLSWRVEILPMLGHKSLYDQFKRDEPWDSAHNRKLLAYIPEVYRSPGRNDVNTNIMAIVTSSSLFSSARGIVERDVEDGLSNTLMLAEVDDVLAAPWSKPADYKVDKANPTLGLGQKRDGVFLGAWGDGSSDWITAKLGRNMYALTSIDGGEGVSVDSVIKDVSKPILIAPLDPTPGGVATTQTNQGTQNVGTDVSQASYNGSSAGGLWQTGVELINEGYEKEGLVHMYAGTVASGDGIEQWQWIPALKRPMPAVRFGFMISYLGPENLLQKGVEPIENPRPTRGQSQGDGGLDKYAGEMGDWLIDELTIGAETNRWNTLLVPAQQDRNQRRRPRTASEYEAFQVGPGVSFVGVIPNREVIKTAMVQQIDVVILLRIQTKEVRIGTSTTTSVRFIDVATRETLYETAEYNNMKVEAARKSPSKVDPMIDIYKDMEKFLRTFEPQPLPGELRAEHVRSRIATIMAASETDELRRLAEVAFFTRKGYLAPQETIHAYADISDAGKELSIATPGSRAEILDVFLHDPQPRERPDDRRNNLRDND